MSLKIDLSQSDDREDEDYQTVDLSTNGSVNEDVK